MKLIGKLRSESNNRPLPVCFQMSGDSMNVYARRKDLLEAHPLSAAPFENSGREAT
jgi:hypothetical protein